MDDYINVEIIRFIVLGAFWNMTRWGLCWEHAGSGRHCQHSMSTCGLDHVFATF